MNFRTMLTAAKNNPRMAAPILEMYRPLLQKEAVFNGIFDEDLYQNHISYSTAYFRNF